MSMQYISSVLKFNDICFLSLHISPKTELKSPQACNSMISFSRVSLEPMVGLGQLVQLVIEVSLATLDSPDQKVPL